MPRNKDDDYLYLGRYQQQLDQARGQFMVELREQLFAFEATDDELEEAVT